MSAFTWAVIAAMSSAVCATSAGEGMLPVSSLSEAVPLARVVIWVGQRIVSPVVLSVRVTVPAAISSITLVASKTWSRPVPLAV